MAKSIVRYSVGRNGTAPKPEIERMTTGERSAGAVRLLVLEGDGIGPEIMAATHAVLRAADRAYGLQLAFETRCHRLGRASRRRHDVSGFGP